MWQLAFKNLMYRKTRSLLTVLGILAAIQLYVVMSNLMDSFDNEIQQQVSGMAGRIIVEYKSDGINSLLLIPYSMKIRLIKSYNYLELIDPAAVQ
jgi:ABC-type lipoprotein release transport system permease subunit